MAASLLQDLHANRRSDDPRRPSVAGVATTVATVRYLSVFLFRLSAAVGQRLPVLGSVIKQINQVVTGADVAWSVQAGPGLVLWHPAGVVIGSGVTIGRDVSLQQGVTLGALRSRSSADGDPSIGDGVYIGAGARVLGPVRIGDGARIGANAVVLKDVPAGAVAVGVPARVIP